MGIPCGDAVIGRPAEIEEGPDGAVYVSDDYANAVYRIVAGESGVAALPARALVVMGGAASLQAYGEERLARLDERGQKAFRRYACAGCHAGKPDQVALVNLATKYDVASLSAYLERPTPPMPAYTYDDETLEALAVHLLVRDTAQ